MSDQDKSEQATPFKLKEAKDKGQVAKSMDLNAWFVFFAALSGFYIWGDQILKSIASTFSFLLSNSGQVNVSILNVMNLSDGIFNGTISAIWPLWALMSISAVFAILFQTGPVFTFFPLKPDMKRLNPVEGFKRLFSMRLVFEFFKTLLKISLLLAFVYIFVWDRFPNYLITLNMSNEQIGYALINNIKSLVFAMMAGFMFIAAIDLIFTKKDFSKKMRMSKKEVKDEHKKKDGDPEIKSKRRQIQRELSAQLSSIGNAKKADVIIINPTHISVALKYDAEDMVAPCVISKGAGENALKIREIARKHNIKMIENKALARAIFRDIDVNSGITPDYFSEVAKIYMVLRSEGLV